MTPESKKLISQFACALSNETIYGESEAASMKRCREYAAKTEAARNALEAHIEQLEDAALAQSAPAQPAGAAQPVQAGEAVDERALHEQWLLDGKIHSKLTDEALALVKHDYSSDALQMASAEDYVKDAVSTLIAAGYRRATLAPVAAQPELLVLNADGVEWPIERRVDGKWQFRENRFGGKPSVVAQQAAAKVVRDWTEDYADGENQYQCECRTCGNSFFGHKRRVTCKDCAAKAPAAQAVAVNVFTCKGKGGTYELVGEAWPAGVLSSTLMVSTYTVYRDATTRRMFVRTSADFAQRMEPIGQEGADGMGGA